MYNIQWPTDHSTLDWDDHLLQTFDQQQARFKVNFSHSFILRHRDTLQFRFFSRFQQQSSCFGHTTIHRQQNFFFSFFSLSLFSIGLEKHRCFGVCQATETQLYMDRALCRRHEFLHQPHHRFFLLAALQNHLQILSKTTKRFSHSKNMKTTLFSTRTTYAFFDAWLCIKAPLSTAFKLPHTTSSNNGTETTFPQHSRGAPIGLKVSFKSMWTSLTMTKTKHLPALFQVDVAPTRTPQRCGYCPTNTTFALLQTSAKPPTLLPVPSVDNCAKKNGFCDDMNRPVPGTRSNIPTLVESTDPYLPLKSYWT